MKIEDFNEMLEEWIDCELSPKFVNWGCWAGDLDLNNLLTWLSRDVRNSI